MRNLLAVCLAAGIVVPSAFALLWRWVERTGALDPVIHSVLLKIQLIVWPSSIMMMATADPNNPRLYWTAFAFSVATNVIFYVIVGIMIWLGITRSKWYLLFPVAGLGLFWWPLFSIFQ